MRENDWCEVVLFLLFLRVGKKEVFFWGGGGGNVLISRGEVRLPLPRS